MARAKKEDGATTEPKAAKKSASKKSAAKSTAAATARISDYAVLLHPVITEKSSLVGGDKGRYVFRVDPRSTKTDIRRAVEGIFNVKVDSVNTAAFIGKVKRTARSVGRRAGFKKAYVTLKEGFTIDIVEGV
jgi:large subunit ribosomal protein L23